MESDHFLAFSLRWLKQESRPGGGSLVVPNEDVYFVPPAPPFLDPPAGAGSVSAVRPVLAPWPYAKTMYCLPLCRNVIGHGGVHLRNANRGDLLARRLVDRVELRLVGRLAARRASTSAAARTARPPRPPAPPLRPVP